MKRFLSFGLFGLFLGLGLLLPAASAQAFETQVRVTSDAPLTSTEASQLKLALNKLGELLDQIQERLYQSQLEKEEKARTEATLSGLRRTLVSLDNTIDARIIAYEAREKARALAMSQPADKPKAEQPAETSQAFQDASDIAALKKALLSSSPSSQMGQGTEQATVSKSLGWQSGQVALLIFPILLAFLLALRLWDAERTGPEPVKVTLMTSDVPEELPTIVEVSEEPLDLVDGPLPVPDIQEEPSPNLPANPIQANPTPSQ